MTERVLVTGIGLVTPLGTDVETVWSSLVAGRSGIAAPGRFGSFGPPTKAVGEVSPDVHEALRAEVGLSTRDADARTVFALAASRRALADARVEGSGASGAGVFLASGPGAHRPDDWAPWYDDAGRFDEAGRLASGRAHPESLTRNDCGRPAFEVARRHAISGPVVAPVTACAASSQAIGLAYRHVRAGRAPWSLAGGADSQVDPMGLVFFVLLNAQAADDRPPAKACRPFSRTRTGMVVGEGAAVLVLESESHARKRGARAYAEIGGYGSALDAFHPTAPHPAARGGVAAMRRALSDASMRPEEIDYVSAHGTGTRKNDPLEARAIREVFGDRTPALAVSSIKSMMGHLLAAAGATTVAAAALAVERDVIPPTINLEDPDPACALDHVRGTARRTVVRAALANALAFGGHNAAVVVRKAPA